MSLFLAQSPGPSLSPASSVPAFTPAVPSASPSPAATAQSGSTYALKDFASNALSLFAIGLGWYNYRRGLAQSQRAQLLTRLQRSVKELDDKSAALSECVENNLRGDLAAYRKCATDWKALQTIEKDLEFHVSCRSEEIFRAVQEWHQATMSDPYPVQIEGRALNPDSSHFDRMRAAQAALHTFLMQLEDSCILGSTRFWHRKGKAKQRRG